MYEWDSGRLPRPPVSDTTPDGSTTDSAPVAIGGSASSANRPAHAFVTELARAMQAVAEHQHEATNAEVQAITRAHLERVRARAAVEAEELRRKAQQDIAAVHAWQEAEAERIRAEAARRIVVRGEELDGYLVRHAALIDREVDQIGGVVASYQLRLDDFFRRVAGETNPAEIARLADQMPEPPDLNKVGGDARAEALHEVAAEGDAAGSSSAPGADPVPVMDLAATPSGDTPLDARVVDAVGADANDPAAGNGSNDNGQEHANPALRLLRSFATFGAPTTEVTSTDRTDDVSNGSSSDATTATAADPTADAGAIGEVAPGARWGESE